MNTIVSSQPWKSGGFRTLPEKQQGRVCVPPVLSPSSIIRTVEVCGRSPWNSGRSKDDVFDMRKGARTCRGINTRDADPDLCSNCLAPFSHSWFCGVYKSKLPCQIFSVAVPTTKRFWSGGKIQEHRSSRLSAWTNLRRTKHVSTILAVVES